MKLFITFLFIIFSSLKFAHHHLITDYPITPVGFEKVHLTDGFWKSRVETATNVTIPYAFKKCEETGRVDNFKKAGGLMLGKFIGHYGFDDSDVYKIMEGASYSLMTKPDPVMKRYLDLLISFISAAQEADGYLYTAWSLKAANDTVNKIYCCMYDPKGRFYGEESSHELYDAGHMYEAAVAHYEATGEKSFLNIATRNADLIYDLAVNHNFGFYSGHQEIEIGLVKLFRATGNDHYLQLAKILLDRRGHAPIVDGKPTGAGSYAQDHKPVIEQTEAVGHSVRAGYMYAAMADIAAITGDQAYLNAIDKLWENIVYKKLYITGGLGAVAGIEGFDKDYVLPNDAYAETCAAIANVYWNHRMFLLHGDAKYIDVLERSLYNSVLPGLSLSGNKFFYPNPLVFDGKKNFNQGANCRKDWFNCSCCPSNLARIIPSVAGYVYATKGNDVYVNLFMNNESTLLVNDQNLTIKQETNYPWSGNIKLTISKANHIHTTFKVRIPGFSRNEILPGDLYSTLNPVNSKPMIKVNGNPISPSLNAGYADVTGTWNSGDVIELMIPFSPILIKANDKVKADSGKIALEYGPLMYCAEAEDNGGNVFSLKLNPATPMAVRYDPLLLNGVNIIETVSKDKKTMKQKYIPYYAWGHREIGEMAVWFGN